MIRQRYREEFVQLGAVDLTTRLNAGLYDEDKRKAARVWSTARIGLGVQSNLDCSVAAI
jgi:hypothetical protein